MQLSPYPIRRRASRLFERRKTRFALAHASTPPTAGVQAMSWGKIEGRRLKLVEGVRLSECRLVRGNRTKPADSIPPETPPKPRDPLGLAAVAPKSPSDRLDWSLGEPEWGGYQYMQSALIVALLYIICLSSSKNPLGSTVANGSQQKRCGDLSELL